MKDEELDRKFQEAAEHAEYPFQAKDWEAMSALLDNPAPGRPVLGWWLRGAGLVALILGLFLAGWISGQKYEASQGNASGSAAVRLDPPEPELGEATAAQLPDTEASQENQEKMNVESSLKSASPSSTKTFATREAQATSASEVQPAQMQSQSAKIIKAPIGTKVRTESMTQNSGNEDLNITGRDETSLANQSESAAGQNHLESHSENDQAAQTRVAESKSFLSEPNTMKSDSLLSTTVALKSDSIVESSHAQQDSAQLPSTRKFALRLMGGIDLTSVGYFHSGVPGFNAGVQAEYFLKPALSVSSGVVWTSKNYFTKVTGYSKSTDITGNCRMFEIPIVLNYYFRNRNRREYFIAAGVSSYIMARESYDYSVYYPYSGTYYSYSQEIVNENRDWLGVAALGIGFARPIAPSWDLIVEPYARIPLKTLGELDLDMVSVGVNMHLRFSKN